MYIVPAAAATTALLEGESVCVCVQCACVPSPLARLPRETERERFRILSSSPPPRAATAAGAQACGVCSLYYTCLWTVEIYILRLLGERRLCVYTWQSVYIGSRSHPREKGASITPRIAGSRHGPGAISGGCYRLLLVPLRRILNYPAEDRDCVLFHYTPFLFRITCRTVVVAVVVVAAAAARVSVTPIQFEVWLQFSGIRGRQARKYCSACVCSFFCARRGYKSLSAEMDCLDLSNPMADYKSSSGKFFTNLFLCRVIVSRTREWI